MWDHRGSWGHCDLLPFREERHPLGQDIQEHQWQECHFHMTHTIYIIFNWIMCSPTSCLPSGCWCFPEWCFTCFVALPVFYSFSLCRLLPRLFLPCFIVEFFSPIFPPPIADWLAFPCFWDAGSPCSCSFQFLRGRSYSHFLFFPLILWVCFLALWWSPLLFLVS